MLVSGRVTAFLNSSKGQVKKRIFREFDSESCLFNESNIVWAEKLQENEVSLMSLQCMEVFFFNKSKTWDTTGV